MKFSKSFSGKGHQRALAVCGACIYFSIQLSSMLPSKGGLSRGALCTNYLPWRNFRSWYGTAAAGERNSSIHCTTRVQSKLSRKRRILGTEQSISGPLKPCVAPPFTIRLEIWRASVLTFPCLARKFRAEFADCIIYGNAALANAWQNQRPISSWQMSKFDLKSCKLPDYFEPVKSDCQ